MKKPPFLVRHFQCPSCILKEKKFCACWGGFQLPMWLVTLRFYRKCITYIDKEPILKEVLLEPLKELEVKIPESRTPTVTVERRVHDGSLTILGKTEQLEKVKEEQIKKEFLPEPQTHRRTIPKSYVPPAERHREAISKAMKGKASSQYLKTIKKSPNIRIEDKDV